MNILILGGNSKRHKEWVRQVADVLSAPENKIIILDYLHWDDPETEFANIPVEVDRATELASQFNGEYVIVAKSVGTGITLIGVAKGKLTPVRCVFFGFPLKGIIEDDQKYGYVGAFKRLPPTTVVQNERDPWGSAEEVKRFVKVNSNSSVKVISMPGDTHDYTDFDLIRKLTINA